VSQEFCRDKLIGKLFEAIIGQKSDHQAQQHMLRVISNKLSGNLYRLFKKLQIFIFDIL